MAVVLSISLFLSACGGSSGTDENDNLVYDSFNNNEFAYKYPSEWETSIDNEDLQQYEQAYGDLYSSGSMAIGNNERMFLVIALDFSDYNDSIGEDDLIAFQDSFQQSFEADTPSAELIEESNLNIDNNSAVRMVYEFNSGDDTIKMDVLATYEGLNFYVVIYGCKKADYNNTLGVFTEMRDSVELY